MPMNTKPEGRCLGLIGGLGPAATIHYYRELVKAHAAHDSVLRLLMLHADVNRVLNDVERGDFLALAEYLGDCVRSLSEAGADVAAVSAVTPHICAPDFERIAPLPIVNLVDEVVREVQQRGLRRVALFGTRFTVTSGLFGQLRTVVVVPPHRQELDYIHSVYVRLVQTGAGAQEDHDGLTAVARRLRARDGVEAIILAGTELSLVFSETTQIFRTSIAPECTWTPS